MERLQKCLTVILIVPKMLHFDEYGIIVKSKPKYSIDWINDAAQGLDSIIYMPNKLLLNQISLMFPM